MSPRNQPSDAGAADTSSAAVQSTAVDASKKAERKPMPEPEGGWPADEFTGKFGHYVRDPFTGIRSEATDAPVYKTPDAY